MIDKDRKAIIFNANKVLDAKTGGDIAGALKYLHRLEKLGKERTLYRPFYEGCLNYIRANLAGEDDSSASLYYKAYNCFMAADMGRGAAVAMLNLSSRARDERESIGFAEKAYAIFKQIHDPIGVSKALSNVGSSAVNLQDYSRARRVLSEAIKYQMQVGDTVGAAISMINLSACCQYQEDLEPALKNAQESIRLLELHTDPNTGNLSPGKRFQWRVNCWKLIPVKTDTYLANAYVNHGNSLRALTDYSAAIESYMAAQKIVRESENVEGQAMVYNQLGEVLRETEDFAEAEEYYRQSRKLFQESGTTGYPYATSLQSIGQACAAQNKYDEALNHYALALAEFRKVAHKAGEAEVLILSGELLVGCGDYKKAVVYLQEGLALARSVSAFESIVRGNRIMGSAMMHLDAAQARDYFSQALLLAEEHTMKIELQSVHRELASYYEVTADPASALTHFKKYYRIEKDIFTVASDRKLKSLQVLNQVEKHKSEAQEARREVDRLQSELKVRIQEMAEFTRLVNERQEYLKTMSRKLQAALAAGSDKKDALIQEMLNAIQTERDVEQGASLATKQFMEAHEKFFGLLLQRSPDLKPAELYLCVMLSDGKNTQQIADELYRSTKSVENHRTRIRKKLNLTGKENLITYMIKLRKEFDAG